MRKLDGRAALVTGGASGMGQASAIRLAAEGANVVIGDIDVDGARETADRIKKAGGQASVVGFDACEEESCVSLVAEAVQILGRLDVVANIAGIAGFYRIDELTAEVFGRYISVNLTCPMLICRESIPHLKLTKGCIINFASVNSRMPLPCHAAYDASKAGVLALTKSLALELAGQGVRCNAICPGSFDTPMNGPGQRFPEKFDMRLVVSRMMNRSIPAGRPDQIAGAVVFLASDDASYVNGEEIVVDGGLTSVL